MASMDPSAQISEHTVEAGARLQRAHLPGCVANDGEIMPAGLLALHRIVWKMVIIAMTQSEMDKTPVSTNQI